MGKRSVQFLLLAAFAFWASGAALFLHERLEHDDAGQSSVSGDVASHTPAQPHDHDHCPVCQLLAHLAATPPLVTPPLHAYRFVAIAVQPPVQTWIGRLLISEGTIRGPPAFCA